MEANVGSGAAPGWYPEPGTGRQRYWDGSQWTDYAPVQAGAGYAAGYQSQGTNGLSIAALVLGILGIITFPWVVLWLLGIIFGAVGLRQTRERNQGGRGMAIAGLVCGLIGALFFVIILIVVLTSNTNYGY